MLISVLYEHFGLFWIDNWHDNDIQKDEIIFF